MKKILTIFILMAMCIVPVFAKENKLYFTSSGDRLFYKTDLYDENVFMKHYDMIPGRLYTDELVIENSTLYDYKLYLKVKEKDQSELADELLDNIIMSIYLDDQLLYEGKARGLDYSNSGVNLQNALFIGEYSSKTSGKIVVNTKLAEEYSNINNDAYASIDWEFYASYEDLVLPVNPDTGNGAKSFIKYVVVSLSIALFLILIVIFVVEKKKFKLKKF